MATLQVRTIRQPAECAQLTEGARGPCSAQAGNPGSFLLPQLHTMGCGSPRPTPTPTQPHQ